MYGIDVVRSRFADSEFMAYTTVLLDLDHTLFDSDASESAAFEKTLALAGIASPSRYRESYRDINLKLWAQVERHELMATDVKTLRFERLVEAAGFAADPLVMANDFVRELGANGELYDGAFDLLSQLKSRTTLALVTNGLGEVQRARIERLGIGAFFSAVVISAEVGTAKPGTDIFDIVFDRLDNPKRSASIMVGDSLSSDMQGGTNYRIDTAWFNPKKMENKRPDLVTHEIATLDSLLSLVAA